MKTTNYKQMQFPGLHIDRARKELLLPPSGYVKPLHTSYNERYQAERLLIRYKEWLNQYKSKKNQFDHRGFEAFQFEIKEFLNELRSKASN